MSEPPKKRLHSETTEVKKTISNNKSSEIVTQYLELLEVQQKERYEYLKKADNMLNKIRKTENKIMKICLHNWVKDYSYTPCDNLPLVCTKCGLNY